MGPECQEEIAGGVPRIIWILWFDGWDDAPELHKRCLASWQLYNPDWEVRPMCRQDLPALLGDFRQKYESLRQHMGCRPAAESDLLRLAVLALHGGVWVDATMLCRRPLSEWLPEVCASGFFAFSPEEQGWLLVMSSFVASAPAHVVTVAWLRAMIGHWTLTASERPALGYFWAHHLFAREVILDGQFVDPAAQEAWGLVPKRSGEYGVSGPHLFVPYSDTLRPPPTAELLKAIKEDQETPMWKLTNWEVKLESVGRESCYWVLLEETRQQAILYSDKLTVQRTAGNDVG